MQHSGPRVAVLPPTQARPLAAGLGRRVDEEPPPAGSPR